MHLFWILATLLAFHGGEVSGGSQCVPNADVITDTMRASRKALLNDVLCSYDRLIIPPKTEVGISVYVYRLNLDLHKGLLEMLVDMSWSWNDPRLVWDPSHYPERIEEIVMSSREIWVPDLDVFNTFSIRRDWDDESSPLRCAVTAMGNVSCNPVFVMHTNCGGSVRNWPFDEHECVFEVMSREYSLVMAFNTTEISMHDKTSQEWHVVSSEITRQEYNVGDALQLVRMALRINLARISDIHVATVAVPAVVLSVLVLAQLWLDPRAPGRIVLGCTTVGSLCLYLMYLSDTVPDDTEGRAPLIIEFYRDSLVIATVVVMQSVAALGLLERTDPPPSWLTSASAWLLSRVPRRVTSAMLLDEDSQSQDGDGDGDGEQVDTEEDSNKVEPSIFWGRVSRLLDRLCFAVLTVTFLVLLIATMP